VRKKEMTLHRKNAEGYPIIFIQGNEACVYGAIHAGCNFFAGYPITPSTEIAEGMARDMPKIGGKFIQMEDEIASIGAVIGASAAGAVAMTATSGPGFSLMQENIGYAFMTQLPLVIVNVQRAGPSTGLPTKLAQADTMQARWGTHGDYTAIALAASSVQETYDITIRAFQLTERFSTPVVVLLDELVGHMREKVVLKKSKNPNPVQRMFPKIPPEWYFPYKEHLDMVSHPAPFGQGFRYSITGLTHDKSGFPTAIPSEIVHGMNILKNKIMMHCQEIWEWEEHYTEDAKYLIVAYGSAARAARGAVESLRNGRIKVGLMHLRTIWPFPYHPLAQIAEKARLKMVFVAENNMGQLIHPVREALPHNIKVRGINRYDGHSLDPYEIVRVVKEKIYA
jgi:2-oxoglutarate ferredoxin oxidoreductase subunit alpha